MRRDRDRRGDARSAKSLEAGHTVCVGKRLDLCEPCSTRSLARFLPLGVADVSEGWYENRNRKIGHPRSAPQLSLMAGRGGNSDCRATKALRQLQGGSPCHSEGVVICTDLRPGKQNLAERVGFEPTLPFRVNTLSKRAPSATRPSLRRKPGKETIAFREVIALRRAGANSRRLGLSSFYGQGRASANRQSSGTQPVELKQEELKQVELKQKDPQPTQEIFSGVCGSVTAELEVAVDAPELAPPAAARTVGALMGSPGWHGVEGSAGGLTPSTTWWLRQ